MRLRRGIPAVAMTASGEQLLGSVIPDRVQFMGFRRTGSIPELKTCCEDNVFMRNDSAQNSAYRPEELEAAAPAGIWGLFGRGRRQHTSREAVPGSAASSDNVSVGVNPHVRLLLKSNADSSQRRDIALILVHMHMSAVSYLLNRRVVYSQIPLT